MPCPAAHRPKISRTIGRLVLFDHALDMGAASVDVVDDAIPIPKHEPPVTEPAFAFLCIASVTRCRPFALEFVGERRQRQHNLVGRRIERSLSVLEVKEYPDASLHQLLQRVGRLDRFAA